MKLLVIAEKPSVARDIARILKYGKDINSAIEEERYVVTWGLGHLMTLADPEDYNKKYKEWKMEGLPTMPEVFKIEVIKQTSRQYQAVKNQIYRGDVGDIIITTDAGRRGELIAWLILKKTGCSKPTRRLRISSVIDKAIRGGFANLKDGREYNNLYDAAIRRTETDWLVGISTIRTLTCKYNAQLSYGRAQTPTPAMIAKREAQIRTFVPQPYSGLQTRKGGLVLTQQDAKTGSRRSFEHGRMKGLAKDLREEPAVMAEVKRTPEKTLPPPLYDLVELQRDADRRFSYSARDTLNIIQGLYEDHKVLTYPRTDSRYLSVDIVPTLKERLKVCSIGPYKTLASRLVNQPPPSKPFFVNNNKVLDHHAIIPTKRFIQVNRMTIGERRIYDLVVRRFLAVLHSPFEYDETSLKADIGGQRSITKGRIVKSQGWKAVYDMTVDGEEERKEGDESEIEDQQLPDLKKGDILKGLSIRMTENKIKPPAPSNEAALLSAMGNPVAYTETEDKTMARTLGETGGLGAAVARTGIIEKLFSGFLLEERSKDICLTSKAGQPLELVPEDLKKPELIVG